MDAALSDWRFWAMVISVVLVLGEVRWMVFRHNKILNGPLDDIKRDVGALKTSAAVIIERLGTHAEDVRILRADIKDERNQREEGTRRIWKRIGGE